MFFKEWVVNDSLDQSSDPFSLSTTQEDKVWIDKGDDVFLSQPLVQAIQHLPIWILNFDKDNTRV